MLPPSKDEPSSDTGIQPTLPEQWKPIGNDKIWGSLKTKIKPVKEAVARRDEFVDYMRRGLLRPTVDEESRRSSRSGPIPSEIRYSSASSGHPLVDLEDDDSDSEEKGLAIDEKRRDRLPGANQRAASPSAIGGLNAPDEAQPNARADDDGIRLEDIDVPAEGSRWAKREGALWGTLYGALGGALAGLALGSAVPVSVETSETNDGKRSPSESDSG